MNTPTTNPIQRFLNYLGRDPQHSMKLFVRGLALFAIGLAFIAAGNYFHHLWQIPGLLFLALGILTAAWGYIGIFSHRLQRIFSRLNSPSDLS